MKILMIGPVPVHWGGAEKWKGGGVSTHIQGLLGAFAEHPIKINLLADNVKATVSVPNTLTSINVQSINRSFWELASRNPARIFQLTKRVFSPKLRGSIPLLQLVRFLGLTLNYEDFLVGFPHDIVHVQHILHRPFICKRVLKIDSPFIITVQSVNYLSEVDHPWHVEMALANYKVADRFIAVSNFVEKKMVEHGADADRIVVIPNGVNVSNFAPGSVHDSREYLGLPHDAFIILFTGNLVPRKGVDILIKAFKQCVLKYPKAYLVLLGEGQEQERLVQLVSDLGVVDRVKFGGFRLLPEMPIWYQACDLFVMPSWAEGLSLSILEAMATGKAVITTYPTVGEHDAIEIGKNGWLTDYGDVEGMASVLEKSVSNSELTHQMGAAARQKAVTQFSWQIISEQTIDVYKQVKEEKTHANRLYPV